MQPVESCLVVHVADGGLPVRVHPQFVGLGEFDWVFVFPRGLDFAHALRNPLQLALSEPLALFRLGSLDEARSAQVRQVGLGVIRLLPHHQRVHLK